MPTTHIRRYLLLTIYMIVENPNAQLVLINLRFCASEFRKSNQIVKTDT